jgi:phospholipid/cholesterol/gamma-HCH transport system permease protein
MLPAAEEALEWFGGLSLFACQVVRESFRRPIESIEILKQIFEIGWRSAPLIVLSGFAVGAVLSMHTRATLQRFGAESMIPTALAFALVKETGPLITGLLVSGRVGAGIGAELGGMRVTEQIDALETLTFDPMSHLVVPRVLASTVMFPVVVAVAMLVGMLSGWAASLSLLDISTPQFLKGVRIFFTSFDVRYGLVKSASFGAAVSLIGCRAGLTALGGAQGVGRSATRAVVISAVMILVLDAFWAVVWLTNRTLK